MKKINLFGLQLSLDIKRKSKKEEDVITKDQPLKEKIFYYILLMSLACFFYYGPLVTRDKYYKVGDVALTDIFAPKTIIYRDDEAREKIIESIVEESEKEYIFSADIKANYVSLFEKFMQEIVSVKKGKSQAVDYAYYEKQSGKNFPDDLDKKLMNFRTKDLISFQNLWLQDLNAIYDAGVFKEGEQQNGLDLRLGSPFDKEFEQFTALEQEVLSLFLAPNYIFDSKGTSLELEEKLKQIPEQYLQIKAGTLIASKGDVFDSRKIHILESLGIYSLRKGITILLSVRSRET